jgi:hypothetical protein
LSRLFSDNRLLFAIGILAQFPHEETGIIIMIIDDVSAKDKKQLTVVDLLDKFAQLHKTEKSPTK